MDRPDPTRAPDATRSPDAIVRRLERALGRPYAAALAVQQAGDAEGAARRRAFSAPPSRRPRRGSPRP